MALVWVLAGCMATASGPDAGQPSRRETIVRLRAKVISFDFIRDPATILAVHPEPAFAMRAHVEQVEPACELLPVGKDVVLGIHSPSMLFGSQSATAVGETFDFRVTCQNQGGKLTLTGLTVVRDSAEEQDTNRWPQRHRELRERP